MTPPSNRPGLYVHLPFCSTLCPYCDFYVLTGEPDRRRRFLGSLRREIEMSSDSPWPSFVDPRPQAPFDTLYFGGGTPSILDTEDLVELASAIDTHLPLARDLWIGLEANPEDVSPRKLAAWKQLGVRFLSLGVQSFADRNLRFLGRAHTSRTGRRSVELARQGGVDTLSLDLIFGLPGQTADAWRLDLEAALELEPDHLSCYQLTVEPGTPFGFRRDRGQLRELCTDRQSDLFLLTHEILSDRGFSAYEVSNFATDPCHRSRHNAKYWSHVPYLGFGPSAHSYVSHRRWWNVRKIRPYESRIDTGRRPIADSESLTRSQICLERLMLGLRTTAGVEFESFPADDGARLWQTNRSLIDELARQELVEIRGRRLIPTVAGMAISEAVARRFELPAS